MIEKGEIAVMTRAIGRVMREYLSAALGPINSRLDDCNQRIVAILPSLKGEKGERGIDGKDGRDGKDGDPGENGRDGKDAEPAKKGDPGKDGLDGKDGRDGKHGERGEKGESIKGERGDPGISGKDGRDGLQIDILPAADLSRSYPRGTFARYDGGIIRSFRDTVPGEDLERSGWEVVVAGVSEITVTPGEDPRSFTVLSRVTGKGFIASSFSVPAMIYRDVYRSEGDYRKGDVVTWGGSAWHCQADKPGSMPGKNGDWRMMVKEGQRGKEGKDGKEGLAGKDGKDGRDLTQRGFDGGKY